MCKIGKLEPVGVADQEKRIPGYDLAKTDQRTLLVPIVRRHHAHWAAPGKIDRAACQMSNGVARGVAGDQFDIGTFVRVEAKRVNGVIRRIKDRAKIFHESDFHVDLQIFYSRTRPEDLIGPAHLAISSATNRAR